MFTIEISLFSVIVMGAVGIGVMFGIFMSEHTQRKSELGTYYLKEIKQVRDSIVSAMHMVNTVRESGRRIDSHLDIKTLVGAMLDALGRKERRDKKSILRTDECVRCPHHDLCYAWGSGCFKKKFAEKKLEDTDEENIS